MDVKSVGFESGLIELYNGSRIASFQVWMKPGQVREVGSCNQHFHPDWLEPILMKRFLRRFWRPKLSKTQPYYHLRVMNLWRRLEEQEYKGFHDILYQNLDGSRSHGRLNSSLGRT